MTHGSFRGWIAIACLAALAGCKAAPAPSAGFADPKLLKPDPNVPFDKYWHDSQVTWSGYTQIYIADVDTEYMLKTTDWQQGERKGEIEKDVAKLAVFMRDSLKKAFRDDPKHRYRVVDAPLHDPHTLILETALIEVIPSKVTLSALELAPFYVGTGVAIFRTASNDHSLAAFEARERDAATGKIIALAADCEEQQYAIIDVRSLTWYSDVDGIIDEWSQQFVQIANQKPGQKIEGASTFRLLPW
ncbi:MAG TPA: DUF3313 family protein [Tepidisphaeraceae bacterium]|nr:DUF3313 family protein [Tepidisphaeraceae bacterium]